MGRFSEDKPRRLSDIERGALDELLRLKGRWAVKKFIETKFCADDRIDFQITVSMKEIDDYLQQMAGVAVGNN